MKFSYNYVVKKATVEELKLIAKLAFNFWVNQPASQIKPTENRLLKQLRSELHALNIAKEVGISNAVGWGIKEMVYIANNQCKPAYFGRHSDIEGVFSSSEKGTVVKFEVKCSSENYEGLRRRQVMPYQAHKYTKKGINGLIWIDFGSYSGESETKLHKVYSMEEVLRAPLAPNFLGKMCHDLK